MSRFPLLFGNAMALPDAGLPELLFHVDLTEDVPDLRALSVTFEMSLAPIDVGGKVVVRPVPLSETWPTHAALELALEMPEEVDIPPELRLAVEDAEMSGCPVPGSAPPLLAYQIALPQEWLMPEPPYILLVFREDLARRIDACLMAHRVKFGPPTDALR